MARCIVVLLSVLLFQSVQAATLLVWGDSLSAGYGITAETAWPVLLDQKLRQEGYRYQIVNASISGETTAGGLSRLPAALQRHKPAVVIIELGANDGLRGQPIPGMRDNLKQMITLAQTAGAKVLLVGMRMPPNFGPVYTKKFQDTFAELSAEKHTALLAFMMDGFAQQQNLFQNDNLHPTAEAQPLILKNIWQPLRPLLHK